MICSFIGHSDTPITIAPKLRQLIVNLIHKQGVNHFILGTHGGYDRMVLSILKDLKKQYPTINYDVILAYMPYKNNNDNTFENTIYPEGLENIPKKFAIIWRNKWMIQKSDFLIAYVEHSWGGAAKILEYAKKRENLQIYNLAEQTHIE